ncbi:transposase [Streptomyces prasinus]|uniref:transposase n=1 Tax=Streptomyces prasinus TaxID=67345 RepID=UPI0036420D29
MPLTDAQWARIEPVLPDRAPERGGRRRDHREVIDAIAFKIQTGAQVGAPAGVTAPRARRGVRWPAPDSSSSRAAKARVGRQRPSAAACLAKSATISGIQPPVSGQGGRSRDRLRAQRHGRVDEMGRHGPARRGRSGVPAPVVQVAGAGRRLNRGGSTSRPDRGS